jgi:hypoxanthine phosphoribosyltransferase
MDLLKAETKQSTIIKPKKYSNTSWMINPWKILNDVYSFWKKILKPVKEELMKKWKDKAKQIYEQAKKTN